MNFIHYKSRISKLLKLYVQFLPFCENEFELFKLLEEIQFLKIQIERINSMKMSEAFQKMTATTKQYESKLQEQF